MVDKIREPKDRRKFLGSVLGLGAVLSLSPLQRASAETKIITQRPHGENSSGSDGGNSR